MKHFAFIALVLVLLFSSPVSSSLAQEPGAKNYEYAIVKWDGPDRLFFNLPDKFELKFLAKEGVTIPREAQNEEFCLAWAANKLAKDGWVTIALDSRRLLMRRAK